MGIFEDTIINIKETIDIIGKKTGKVVDVSKLKLGAAEIENDIKKLFEKLGEMVYNKKEISDDNVMKVISDINELYIKLDDIKKKIALVRDKKKCPDCDFENEKEALFCSKCGRKFLDDEENKNDKEYETKVDIEIESEKL